MTMRYGAVLQSSCENRLVALQERRGREAAEALTATALLALKLDIANFWICSLLLPVPGTRIAYLYLHQGPAPAVWPE